MCHSTKWQNKINLNLKPILHIGKRKYNKIPEKQTKIPQVYNTETSL